ncbi:methylamine utilization protein [Glaciecola sp. SC05]|uniref:methylamine utilization protein n=1 Tax=Glaciecola sp. SC05 TaxID=1987355 RepID=UPI003529AFC8
MRFLFLLCLFSFQVDAAFTVIVLNNDGKPVPDAVLAAPVVEDAQKQNAELPIAIMDQVGMQFKPHVLIVNTHQLVSFPNSDDTRHHVYSFSEPKVFELKLFKGTNSKPISMETAGVVELGCNIHDQMLGFIYVDNSGTAVKTNQAGQAVFVGEKPKSLTLWHPRLARSKGELLSYSLDETNEDGNYVLLVDISPKVPDKSHNKFKSRFKRPLSGQSE